MPGMDLPRACRRIAIATALTGLAACVLPGCRGPEPAAPAGDPHVIVYLIDTLRADHVGCYGYERDTTPTLDRLAGDGVLFERPYTPSSWTRATVGSIFTGLLPPRHGAQRRDQALRADVPTLAEVLQARGYATAGFVSNPNVLPVFGFGRGFDQFVDVESVSRDTRAAEVHAAVFDYLDRRQDRTQPLFLYIHTRDPHAPYEPLPPFDERFQPDPAWNHYEKTKALYDGEIAYNDQELAGLLERLEQEGIAANALMVFLSDHGEEFFEHGGWQHGSTLFEEQLMVPLIATFPAGAHAGSRVERPVRVMDLLPTIAEVVGAEPPGGTDALSFLPLVTGGADAEYSPPNYAHLDLDIYLVSSLIDGDLKLVRRELPEKGAGVKLFDLAADPLEKDDLAPTEPGRVADLAAQLDRVEGAFAGGIRIELVNAGALDARHTLRGSVQPLGGGFGTWSSAGLEEGDQMSVDVSTANLQFAVVLANQPNPIGAEPPVIVDVDHIEFTLPRDTAAAGFRVSLEVDGVPAGEEHWLLGSGAALAPLGHTLDASPGDARLAVRSLGRAQPAERATPACRIYEIVQPEVTRVEIDEDLDARLRALGYLR